MIIDGIPSKAVMQMVLYFSFYDEAVSKVMINTVLETLYNMGGSVAREPVRLQYELLRGMLLVPHPQAPAGMWKFRLHCFLQPENSQSFNFLEV
jgi:hypothetical protein